jgi:hypothetical protein
LQRLEENETYFVRQVKEMAPKRETFQNEGPHRANRPNAKRVRSISVRWFPMDIKESRIREHFKTHGKIRNIVFRAADNTPGHGSEAVISFNHWKSAESAVNTEVCRSDILHYLYLR